MEDVAQSVNETELYSLEFEQQGTQEIASLCYWKSDQHIKVQLCRYSPVYNPARNQLLVTVEQSSLRKKIIEYLFRYTVLLLHKLMHKREGSVFGRIDFYTQLKYLVAFPAGSLDQPWIVHTPELANVSITDCVLACILHVSSAIH